MSHLIHQPYDKFFKAAMSNLLVAKQFFETHLPDDIKKLLDFESLQFHKETFITDDLKFQAADVVYSVNFANQAGYLYLLIEQQTKPDKWLPFRMQKYLMGLMDHYHRQYPNADLPLVYPIIFYNGSKPYDFSTDFYDLFGKNSILCKKMSTKPIQLLDIQKISDEEIKKRQWSGIIEFVLKHQKARKFWHVVEDIMRWLHHIECYQDYNYAKLVLQYIISQSESKDLKRVVSIAKHYLSPPLGEEAMTVAEAFTRKGFEQGIQQGMQQGMQLVAKNLLAEGVSFEKIIQWTGLTQQEIEHLMEVSHTRE